MLKVQLNIKLKLSLFLVVMSVVVILRSLQLANIFSHFFELWLPEKLQFCLARHKSFRNLVSTLFWLSINCLSSLTASFAICKDCYKSSKVNVELGLQIKSVSISNEICDDEIWAWLNKSILGLCLRPLDSSATAQKCKYMYFFMRREARNFGPVLKVSKII